MCLKERKEKIKEAFKDFRTKGIRAKYCESNVWRFIQEHENSIAYTKYDLEAMERTNSIQFTWKGDGEKIFNILPRQAAKQFVHVLCAKCFLALCATRKN